MGGIRPTAGPYNQLNDQFHFHHPRHPKVFGSINHIKCNMGNETTDSGRVISYTQTIDVPVEIEREVINRAIRSGVDPADIDAIEPFLLDYVAPDYEWELSEDLKAGECTRGTTPSD